MSEPSFLVPIDDLLVHESFLRSLAKSLLFDESQVDDVIQQAWIAAMQSPPKERASLRSWLGVVTRNQALRARQKEKRLRTREESFAKPESLESVSHFLEKESLRREVVDAVMQLEEPYRETVLLRYFDGMPPRRIAKNAGLAVATIYERNRRALEMLRAKLDERYGGNRSAWALGLVPIAAQGAKAFSVTATAILAAGAFLALSAATFFVFSSGEKTQMPLVAALNPPATDSKGASSLALVAEPSSPTREAIVGPNELSAALVTDQESRDGGKSVVSGKLRGRLLDLKGRPLPAKMPWPWDWAKGEGFPYFRLGVWMDSPPSKIADPTGPSGGAEGSGVIGVLGPVTASREGKVSEVFTIYPDGIMPVPILNYDEADGSFSVEIPDEGRDRKIYVEFLAAGQKKRREAASIGESSEILLSVDFEEIKAQWGFAEATTLEAGSGTPLLVGEWQLRAGDSIAPTSAYQAVWISASGHSGIASPVTMEFDGLLTIPGFGIAVAERMKISSGQLGEPRTIFFEKEAQIRAKCFLANEPIRFALNFELLDSQNKLLWKGRKEPSDDGSFFFPGIPTGSFKLRSTLRALPWDPSSKGLEGLIDVDSFSGREFTADIVMSEQGQSSISIQVTSGPGQTENHRFEIVGEEKTISLPSITLSGGGSTGTVGLARVTLKGKCRVIWYVNEMRKSEKWLDLDQGSSVSLTFP